LATELQTPGELWKLVWGVSSPVYGEYICIPIDLSPWNAILFVFENQKDAYNYITLDKVETLFLLNDMYIEKEASELKDYILETFK